MATESRAQPVGIGRAGATADIDPVRELIDHRLNNGSRPGHREDGYKLGLAVEGGGMRAVVTGAMMGALESLGLRDVFDVVFGSSGGAPNGAYFVARQAAYGMSIYLDYISGAQFISPRRVLQGKPLIDLSYGFEEVIGRLVPLDCDEVMSSPVPLRVVATNVESGEPETLEIGSRADLILALHASARVPMLGGPPLNYHGSPYWDANLTDPLGVRSALRDGCTHVLALRSRPGGLPPRKLNLFERLVVHPYIRRVSPALAERFLSRFDPAVTGENRIGQWKSAPYVSSIRPLAGALDVHRLERSRPRLVSGAKGGVEAVFDYFDLPQPLVIESLSIFDAKGHRIFPNAHMRS